MTHEHEWTTYGFRYPRSRRCTGCPEVRHDVTDDLDRVLGRDVDSDRLHPSRWLFWERLSRKENRPIEP